MCLRKSPDITPARLAGNRLNAINAELKFSATHQGRGSGDTPENKGVIDGISTVSQNLISLKQKELA